VMGQRKVLGYVKQHRSQWLDVDFNALPQAAQWLYNRLTGAPGLSPCGVVTMTAARLSRLAPDMTVETVDGMLDMLEAARYIVRDFDTDEMLVRSYIRHDLNVRNPKMVAAVRNSLPYVESARLAAAAELELRRVLDEYTESEHTAEFVDNQETPARSRSDSDPIAMRSPSSLIPNPSTLIPNPPPPVDNHVDDSPNPTTTQQQAIDAYSQWRTNQHNPKNPTTYLATVKRNTTRDHGPTITAYLQGKPDATPYDICTHILDMPKAAALKHLTTKQRTP
jgi:hypothetical protein